MIFKEQHFIVWWSNKLCHHELYYQNPQKISLAILGLDLLLRKK